MGKTSAARADLEWVAMESSGRAVQLWNGRARDV